MELLFADASPFARKVRICVLELGLEDRVSVTDPGAVTPVSNNTQLNDVNPLGMLPALTLDNGDSLYDSPVICDYLNELADGHLNPSSDTARWHDRKLHALADGIMDLAVALRYETALRPEALHWSDWQVHQQEKIDRALAYLETQTDAMGDNLTMGSIAVGSALGYLDFRFSDRDWRAGSPLLAEWFARISELASFQATAPNA